MVYLWVKWLHVLAAIAALGSNLTYATWLSLAARDEKDLAFALRGIERLEGRLANPSYVILLITGLLLVFLGRLPMTTPWLLAALVLYILTTLVGIFGFAPHLRRQRQLAGSPGPASEEYLRAAGRSLRLGVLTIGIVVVIVFLMVVKPRLW
jgi:uncharacterized membrane protein